MKNLKSFRQFINEDYEFPEDIKTKFDDYFKTPQEFEEWVNSGDNEGGIDWDSIIEELPDVLGLPHNDETIEKLRLFVKEYNDINNCTFDDNSGGYSEVDIMDDLKSNFRSWEIDHDNEDDANGLFVTLMTRHPDVEAEKVREIAYQWVGYEPKEEE